MNPKLKLFLVVLSIVIIISGFVFFRNNINWFTKKEVLAPAIYNTFTDKDLELVNDFEVAIQFDLESLFKKQGSLTWQDLLATDKSNKKTQIDNLSQEYKNFLVARWNKIKTETGADPKKVELELYLEMEYEAEQQSQK
jgi:hypothetical protein